MLAVAALTGGCSIEESPSPNERQGPPREQRSQTSKREPAATPARADARLRIPGLGPQSGDPEGCRLVGQVVEVEIDASDYPRSAAHVRQATRLGELGLLHIDRAGAEENRDQSLAGIPTRDGYDRDELPPAMSHEGGAGAHVAYVPYSDNRGAGASMGHQLSDYCSGQAFRMVVVP